MGLEKSTYPATRPSTCMAGSLGAAGPALESVLFYRLPYSTNCHKAQFCQKSYQLFVSPKHYAGLPSPGKSLLGKLAAYTKECMQRNAQVLQLWHLHAERTAALQAVCLPLPFFLKTRQPEFLFHARPS